MPTDEKAQLAAIPAAWSTPDPSTLAYIPKGGIQLAYMGHGEVTLALIEIDPLWTWEPLGIVDNAPVITKLGKRLVMWGYVTVYGKKMLGVGTCDDSKFEPEKELIGDLLRNVAMRFGVATKLWSKAVDADAAGSGGAGGYDDRPPTPDPIAELAKRVAQAAGTPLADTLKEFAKENSRKLSAAAFAEDPKWAEQVEAVIKRAEIAAAHLARTTPTQEETS